MKFSSPPFPHLLFTFPSSIPFFSIRFITFAFMKRLLILLFVWAFVVPAGAVKRGKPLSLGEHQVYVAGRLGVSVPLGVGRAEDEVSFPDVVSAGFAAAIDGMFMQSEVVGIGMEVGFNAFPYRDQFWSALNYRGTFEASYQDIHASLTGRLFLGRQDVKPYFGIKAGGHFLRNSLSFVSNMSDSADDESVSYSTDRIYPGFGVEGGIFFRTSRTVNLSIAVRLNMIPFLKEDVLTFEDAYTFQEKKVVVNPHGNQNNIEFVVGLHFGVRKNIRY